MVNPQIWETSCPLAVLKINRVLLKYIVLKSKWWNVYNNFTFLIPMGKRCFARAKKNIIDLIAFQSFQLRMDLLVGERPGQLDREE